MVVGNGNDAACEAFETGCQAVVRAGSTARRSHEHHKLTVFDVLIVPVGRRRWFGIGRLARKCLINVVFNNCDHV